MNAVLAKLQEKVDALEKERDTLRKTVGQMCEALEECAIALDNKSWPELSRRAAEFAKRQRKEHGP